MYLNKEKEWIPTIIRKAYNQIITPSLQEGNVKAMDKGNNDIVTACDIEVEKFIIASIKERFPEDHFISEEMNSENSMKKRTWIIDPIDGTVNFSKGIPLFGMQLALVEHGEPVFSVIYLPYTDEMYIALKGHGATVNGQLLLTSNVVNLRESLISFGDFSTRIGADERRENQITTVSNLYSSIRKLKMFGASSIDFTCVASGKTEGLIIYTRNLWDLLPGYLMVKEAGGVSNYDPKNPCECIVVAANDDILNALLEKVAV